MYASRIFGRSNIQHGGRATGNCNFESFVAGLRSETVFAFLTVFVDLGFPELFAKYAVGIGSVVANEVPVLESCAEV